MVSYGVAGSTSMLSRLNPISLVSFAPLMPQGSRQRRRLSSKGCSARQKLTVRWDTTAGHRCREAGLIGERLCSPMKCRFGNP